MKILIWGIGRRSTNYMNNNYFERDRIIGFVDTYNIKDNFMGYQVYKPEEVSSLEYDYVVIAVKDYEEILFNMPKYGISFDKVVITECIMYSYLERFFMRLKQISPVLFDKNIKIASLIARLNESDCVDTNRMVGKNKYSDQLYIIDYYRYRTFELVSKEILRNKVEGSLAEVGVFRGAFSSLINEHFSDRKLYLFDTFEGFDEKESANEIAMGRCDEGFIKAHKNTSVELMLSNIPYPENVVVCKGFFPDTVTEEAKKEKYAFVSLDVDFEESTLAGLRFFYPRMSENGIIFIHDYTTYYLEGIRAAVERYEAEIGYTMKKVPLADRAGTLVIVK